MRLKWLGSNQEVLSHYRRIVTFVLLGKHLQRRLAKVEETCRSARRMMLPTLIFLHWNDDVTLVGGVRRLEAGLLRQLLFTSSDFKGRLSSVRATWLKWAGVLPAVLGARRQRNVHGHKAVLRVLVLLLADF